jgi:serine/threonine protein kinase
MIDHHIGQLFGNYRLISRIGSGGFATVYQAEHIYLSTRVAVKLSDANLANGLMMAKALSLAALTRQCRYGRCPEIGPR